MARGTEKELLTRLNACSTRDEIMSLKFEIDREIALIKDQLEDANAHQKTTGEYADPHWFRAANAARRMYGRMSQMCQQKASKMKKTNNRSVSDYFVEICKEIMDEEEFSGLLEDAKHMKACREN